MQTRVFKFCQTRDRLSRVVLAVAGLLFFLPSYRLTAQPDTPADPCQAIDTDWRSGQYRKAFEAALEAGDLQRAAIFGFHRLRTENKQKRIAEARQALTDILEAAVAVSERIRALNAEARVVQGERTLALRKELVCEYRKYALIRQAYDLLPIDRIDETIRTVIENMTPYEQVYRSAVDSVTSAELQVADLYHQYATRRAGTNRQDYHYRIGLCNRGLELNPSHAELGQLREALTDSFRGDVELREVRFAPETEADPEANLAYTLGEELAAGLAYSPYYDVVKEGGNVHLVIDVTNLQMNRVREEPTMEDLEAYVGDRAVRAKLFYHTKGVVVKLTAVYDIIDAETGESLGTDSVAATGNHRQEWHSYSGDEAALSDHQRSLITPEPEWPEAEAAAVNAFDQLARSIAESVSHRLTQPIAVDPIPVFDDAVLANTDER